MHIWLTIYNYQSPQDEVIQNFSNVSRIPTLKNHQFVNYEWGEFSFFSWIPSARTFKTYLKKNEQGIYGYSGTVIDDSGNLEDLRHIKPQRLRKRKCDLCWIL